MENSTQIQGNEKSSIPVEGKKFNVIFFDTENNTLFFYGFAGIGTAARFSDSKDGMYIAPVEDLTEPGCFAITNHKSFDTKLIEHCITKGALNYHFGLGDDGKYFQSHIAVQKSDVNFYSQFPEKV